MPRFRIEVPRRNSALAPERWYWSVMDRVCDNFDMTWYPRVGADVVVYEGEADEDLITDLMRLARGEW